MSALYSALAVTVLLALAARVVLERRRARTPQPVIRLAKVIQLAPRRRRP